MSAQTAYLQELYSFLNEENMSPEMGDDEIQFVYSGGTYHMSLVDAGEGVTVALFVEQPYDDVYTRSYIIDCGAPEGIQVEPLADEYRVLRVSSSKTVESYKYSFYKQLRMLSSAVESIKPSVLDDALMARYDEAAWRKVNKESRESIRNYINAKVDYPKKHLMEAQKLLQDIDESEDWYAIDTKSIKELTSFTKRYPNSSHVDEAFSIIDDINWGNVSESSESSLKGYIESDAKVKKHLAEAERLLNGIHDNQAWSAVSKESLASLTAYRDNPTIDNKLHLEECEAYIMMAEALRIKNDALSSADYYEKIESKAESILGLLEQASNKIVLSDPAKSLLDDAKGVVAFKALSRNMNMDSAAAFIEKYPYHWDTPSVRDWYAQNSSLLKRCDKLRSRILIDTDTFNEYSRKVQKATPASYYNYLKNKKKEGITSVGGRRFRFSLGLDGMIYEGDPLLGASVGFKLGNYMQFVNLESTLTLYTPVDSMDDIYVEHSGLDVALKLNLLPLGKKCRGYIAPGLYFPFDDSDLFLGQVKAGLSFKSIDIGAYVIVNRELTDFNYYDYGVTVKFYL